MADAAKKKKSAGSVEKGKKGKMSKADKDKLKKEEQERKAFEEEAARMQAQEEAKLKKKEEAIMAVERVKLENEERRRRRVEMSDLQIVLASVSMQIRQFHSVRRQNEKWARYMKCDGSPDPTNQGEINTYINLRLEDKTRNDSISVLADSVLDLKLIQELQQLLEDSPHDELLDIQRSLYYETIHELQNLIAVKLDLATLQILCDATMLADPETGNLQHIIKNDQITLCTWGNIMKNPRVKSFEFPEIHFTFDIPRILGLSDCAVRLMNTKFDHLSPMSKAILPRFKKNKEIQQPIQPEENKGPKEEEEEGPKEEGEKTIETKEEGSSYDVSQGLSRISGTDDEPKTEEEQEVVEALEEDFPDPPTPEPLDFEDFDEDDDIVDLRAYDVLGGVYTFNLLHLPPQPKTVGAWTITQLVDPPQIEVYEYMTDAPQTHEDSKKEKERKDDKPPIGVSMLLPAHAVFLESPTVARWDYDRKLWSTRGFSDQNFNENTRTFSFKTTHFGTLCLLQDTHINMPFQSWTLRPHRLNSAVLTITAAILEVEIEIKDGLCSLSQPKDRTELAHIIDKWFTPAELIKVMKQAGVNIFPNEDSLKFVAIQCKNALIEDRLYHQMALTASALAFTWTKWNSDRSKNELVFQAAEALEDEPIMEENWSMFMATKRRVMKLRVSEYDDSFSQSQELNPSELRLQETPRIVNPSNTQMLGTESENVETIALGRVSLGPGSYINQAKTDIISLHNIVEEPEDVIVRNKSKSVLDKRASAIRSKTSEGSKMFRKNSPTQRLSSQESKTESWHGKRKTKKRKEAAPVDLFLKAFDVKSSPYKSNLYHLMNEIGSKTTQERIETTSYFFINSVYQLLKATKVLTYS